MTLGEKSYYNFAHSKHTATDRFVSTITNIQNMLEPVSGHIQSIVYNTSSPKPLSIKAIIIIYICDVDS
jgi:hypothetical protein